MPTDQGIQIDLIWSRITDRQTIVHIYCIWHSTERSFVNPFRLGRLMLIDKSTKRWTWWQSKLRRNRALTYIETDDCYGMNHKQWRGHFFESVLNSN